MNSIQAAMCGPQPQSALGAVCCNVVSGRPIDALVSSTFVFECTRCRGHNERCPAVFINNHTGGDVMEFAQNAVRMLLSPKGRKVCVTELMLMSAHLSKRGAISILAAIGKRHPLTLGRIIAADIVKFPPVLPVPINDQLKLIEAGIYSRKFLDLPSFGIPLCVSVAEATNCIKLDAWQTWLTDGQLHPGWYTAIYHATRRCLKTLPDELIRLIVGLLCIPH